jgi:hypothetical protein
MSVIDLQRNHTGVQSVITQFANYAAAGQGAMLYHTDGYVYCVFAQNYMNAATNERRLYMTRSNDNGLTWGNAITLTTGNFDDKPAIIQLDTTDPASNIGIVFMRDVTMVRVLVDKDDGSAQTPFDVVTNSSSVTATWIGVVKTSTGYLIAAMMNTSITTPTIKMLTNTSFTTNNWALASKTIFPTNQQPMSLSIKRLSNGHLALIGAYRTSLNGATTTSQTQNLPNAMVRCDVGVSFSADDGKTWTAIQPLSSYTGTLAVDLIGIKSVASADLEQLSDGTIVVAYQEHTAPQYIGTSTSPLAFPATIGKVQQAVYHSGHNMLIACSDNVTNGGVWVFDLTAQTRTRIWANAGSAPPIWTNDAYQVQLSPDQTKLAVGLATGGIAIIDVTDADPANWTIVKELRTTSTPSILSNSIYRVLWGDDDTLYWTYTAQVGSGKRGQFYIISSNTVATLTSSFSGNLTDIEFIIANGAIYTYCPGASNTDSIEKFNLAGTSLYVGTTGDAGNFSIRRITYNNVNSEIITWSFNAIGVGRLCRVNDSGSALSIIASYTQTSNPAIGEPGSSTERLVTIPGKGVFIPDKNDQLNWYSFHSNQIGQFRSKYDYLSLGENADGMWGLTFGIGYGSTIEVSSNNCWLALPGTNQITLQSLDNVGRIRYGYFSYDSVNKQLVTAGVDFYDVGNSIHLTDLTHLQFPKFCRDADDRLYFYFNRWNPDQNGNELAPVIGVVEPDTKKLFMLARIRNIYTKTLTSKSRIRNIYTRIVTAQSRLSIVHCIKAKCHIVARNTWSLTAKSAIQNRKTLTIPMTYSVQGTNTARMRLTFYVNTGYNRVTTFTSGAHIIKLSRVRMTGHFTIPAVGLSNAFIFSTAASRLQQISARAKIESP